ncbi:hypothetical protein TNCV_4433911 [Trichonephila clavipes]|nr:hypothetical protein TNCV_4433911 [Trichonephila clavipes]
MEIDGSTIHRNVLSSLREFHRAKPYYHLHIKIIFDPSPFVNRTPPAHAYTSRDVLPMGGTSQVDETWCFQYDRKTKRQIAEWKPKHSPQA